MIVVAIIGVLAALAVYGVTRYLASAKTSEAKHGVGAITRGAVAAYERELEASALLTEGSLSLTASHQLCDSATPVPLVPPAARKYQPRSGPGLDFNSGTTTAGWQCLKFKMKEPSYYQYNYLKDGNTVAGAPPCAMDCFSASAQGDLDGDSDVSGFERVGIINTTTHTLRTATELHIANELE